MELSDFIAESNSNLQVLNLDNTCRLVGTVEFHLKEKPDVGYCVDFHYNGRGALHEQKSWTLDHITVSDTTDAENELNEVQLNEKLHPYDTNVWTMFYELLLKKIEKDYPKIA